MEENVQEGILSDDPVNLPIQMMSLTDRDGRMTPQWFRLETEDHEIRMYGRVQGGEELCRCAGEAVYLQD